MSQEPFDSGLCAALDHYTVPPLAKDFADRLVAKALSPPTIAVPVRRDTRGGWRRGRTLMLAIGGFGLVSAAAAATGVFGDVAKDVPVIGRLIASVAPAKPKPVDVAPPPAKAKHAPPAPAQLKPALPAPPPLIADAPAIEVPPPIIERGVVNRARIERRIERLQARRAEQGLPLLADPQARAIARLSLLPPAKQVEIKVRVKAKLDEARAQGTVTPNLRRQLIIEELKAIRAEAQAKRRQAAPPDTSETATPATSSEQPNE
jgi:hypothetical protein